MFLNCGVGKTLESLLDCKKIKLVNPKGNQSWIATGRTVVEAEAPILWPPDAKNWLISSVQLISRVLLFETPWLQHARLPCPSPTPRVYSNSCPWISDATQPSYPLSSPSPPTFNLSQDQGLFKWVSSSHQVAKILAFQLQHQSFQRIFRTDLL